MDWMLMSGFLLEKKKIERKMFKLKGYAFLYGFLKKALDLFNLVIYISLAGASIWLWSYATGYPIKKILVIVFAVALAMQVLQLIATKRRGK